MRTHLRTKRSRRTRCQTHRRQWHSCWQGCSKIVAPTSKSDRVVQAGRARGWRRRYTFLQHRWRRKWWCTRRYPFCASPQHTHTHTHAHTQVFIQIHTHTQTLTLILRSWNYPEIENTHTHRNAHTNTHKHTHTHTHTNTHTHTHTHKQ
jgi:hypothetical protein